MEKGTEREPEKGSWFRGYGNVVPEIGTSTRWDARETDGGWIALGAGEGLNPKGNRSYQRTSNTFIHSMGLTDKKKQTISECDQDAIKKAKQSTKKWEAGEWLLGPCYPQGPHVRNLTGVQKADWRKPVRSLLLNSGRKSALKRLFPNGSSFHV